MKPGARPMFLVESDDDLASFVEAFFRDRYEVTRLSGLSGIAETSGPCVLFADVGSGSTEEVTAMERLRQERPGMRIVITYLKPLADPTWEARLRHCADILVRKPYRLLDVDRILRELSGRNRTASN